MTDMPKYYGGIETEKKIQDFWEDRGIYKYSPLSKKPVFSVDTPPPTVSGKLHIGHVFSYTQAEIMARYKRMKGFEVFYPFGFDDNGLPTERLVEKKMKKSAGSVDRADFIENCLSLSAEVEKEFKELWKSLGFSADWDQLYSTIDDRSRRISQRSFIDLFNKGLVKKKATPALYCPNCRTTVAQAETDDMEMPSRFVDLRFRTEEGEDLVIATTRPELIPALVAVFVHPDDSRYAALVGKMVTPPLFDLKVKVMTDEKVDMEKGTGAVMCCTFGDTTDVEWYHTHSLPLRQVIDERGRMNEAAGKYCGMKIAEARVALIEDLKEGGYVSAIKEISHPVNTHDRCGKPMEYIVKEQWFIDILDHKDELIALADRINWYPSFMKERYLHWVSNLKWDWGISRQRFYGVPFPLWYCKSCGQPVVASDASLPVDPLTQMPEGACPGCGATEFEPETDVMDTWATSSVTPQINGKWGEQDDRMKDLFPMDLRPQAHDIIRTWAFYTIVKSYFHHNSVPWKNIMISGHSLDPERKKISKSKGNAGISPQQLVEKFSADPVRYWTAGSRLGMDTFFSEDVLKDGRKLVTKLWNASKFAIMNLQGYDGRRTGPLNIIDRWIIHRMNDTIKRATDYMDRYEYGLALNTIESFFWKDLCDNYIELVKGRLSDGNTDADGSRHTLYNILFKTLKLFAPFVPHITEEIYLMYFKDFEQDISIHLAEWPLYDDKNDYSSETAHMADLLRLIDLIRKAKSENKLSLAYPVKRLHFSMSDKQAADSVMPQIISLMKIEEISDGGLSDPDFKSSSEDGSVAIEIVWGER